MDKILIMVLMLSSFSSFANYYRKVKMEVSCVANISKKNIEGMRKNLSQSSWPAGKPVQSKILWFNMMTHERITLQKDIYCTTPMTEIIREKSYAGGKYFSMHGGGHRDNVHVIADFDFMNEITTNVEFESIGSPCKPTFAASIEMDFDKKATIDLLTLAGEDFNKIDQVQLLPALGKFTFEIGSDSKDRKDWIDIPERSISFPFTVNDGLSYIVNVRCSAYTRTSWY